MNSRFKYLRSRGNVTNRPWPGSVKKEGGGGGWWCSHESNFLALTFSFDQESVFYGLWVTLPFKVAGYSYQ